MTELLTISDLQRLLKISRATAYSLAKRVGYVKVGGCVRFRPSDVERYVDGQFVLCSTRPKAKPVKLVHL
jgi:hypothetical protein